MLVYLFDRDATAKQQRARAILTVAFRLPSDIHGPPDITPAGERAVVIRGGPIYQDLIVVEGALRSR